MFYTIREGIIKFEIIIFMICALSISGLINNAYCQDNMVSPNSVSIGIESVDRNDKQNEESEEEPGSIGKKMEAVTSRITYSAYNIMA